MTAQAEWRRTYEATVRCYSLPHRRVFAQSGTIHAGSELAARRTCMILNYLWAEQVDDRLSKRRAA